MYNVWLQSFEIQAINHGRYHKENNTKTRTSARCHFNKTHRVSHSFPLLAFERGHCYEPYLQNGNFTTTDPLYGVGAVVQFTCDPGHSLEQGPPVIECISARDPYWNDTEPLCKGNTEGTILHVFHVKSLVWTESVACGDLRWPVQA